MKVKFVDANAKLPEHIKAEVVIRDSQRGCFLCFSDIEIDGKRCLAIEVHTRHFFYKGQKNILNNVYFLAEEDVLYFFALLGKQLNNGNGGIMAANHQILGVSTPNDGSNLTLLASFKSKKAFSKLKANWVIELTEKQVKEILKTFVGDMEEINKIIADSSIAPVDSSENN